MIMIGHILHMRQGRPGLVLIIYTLVVVCGHIRRLSYSPKNFTFGKFGTCGSGIILCFFMCLINSIYICTVGCSIVGRLEWL